jgi:TonB family protein
MSRLLLAVACLFGLWATGPTLPDRPAIPVITTDPITPPEAAGRLEKSPTARLQLSISETGRVTAVKVVKIEPTSEFDEVLKQAIAQSVQSWRFGPALKSGKNVAVEQELSLTFVPAERATPDYEHVDQMSTDTDRFDDLAYVRRFAILNWPLERRLAEQRRISANAEALLDKDKRVTATNEWFEVVTDSGNSQEQAKAIASSMSASYATLNRVIGRRLTAYASAGLVKVYVFRTEAKYKQLCEQLAEGLEYSSGFYDPSGVIAYHVETGTSSRLYSVLIHEATHAAMDRHITRPGVMLPRSLDEGFASYLGNSDIVDGQIMAGRSKHRNELRPVEQEMGMVPTPTGYQIEIAKRVVRQGKALSLWQLLRASPETFYGEQRELYYAQGWLLVHFLRHAEPSWEDEQFPRFMLYVAEGYDSLEALRQVYGSDLAVLEKKFSEYMRKF